MEDETASSRQEEQQQCDYSSSNGALADNDESEESQRILHNADEEIMEVGDSGPTSSSLLPSEDYSKGWLEQFLLFGCGVGCSLCCKFTFLLI
jgi:hypothetical protein